MAYRLKRNQATRPLVFLMVATTDHIDPETGAIPAVLLSKNGGAFAAPVGAVVEIGLGWYKVGPNATDCDTLGPLVLHATATGADPVDIMYEVVAYDPDNAVSLGLTNLDVALSAIEPTIVSPALSEGLLEIVRGDTYDADEGRAITWTDTSSIWPDLTGATLSFAAGGLSGTPTCSNPGAAQQVVTLELTSAETDDVSAGNYIYQLWAVMPSTLHVVTLDRGTLRVLKARNS